jgi:SAM-dependent methyltransferase
MATNQEHEGLEWQRGVWNRIADIYQREIDSRFAPVVEHVIARSTLQAGQSVLDLGTGTGVIAAQAASLVGLQGHVVAVDLSPDMLAAAQQRFTAQNITQIIVREGRAEDIPAEDHAFDVVLASPSFMYLLDRAAAARELARVLRPGGRLVAAVWAGADECDIVLFQQTAGQFAGTPPVSGVGPGSLADPSPFLTLLADNGITAYVERETLGFEFADFTSAWDALAGVTTAHLVPERQQEAKNAVRAAMYPDGEGPRHFRNVTQFIMGSRDR